MTLAVQTISDALKGNAQKLGVFSDVVMYEPTAPPTGKVTLAISLRSIGPARMRSGLSQTSALIVFNGFIYMNAVSSDPADRETKMLSAVSELINALSGDFDLGGNVQCVDLLGMAGQTLSAELAYRSFGEGTLYRTAVVTIPLIVNDVWNQEA